MKTINHKLQNPNIFIFAEEQVYSVNNKYVRLSEKYI